MPGSVIIRIPMNPTITANHLKIPTFSLNKNIEYTFIRNWIVFLSKNKISPNSINRKVSSLKAYFKFLVNIKEIKKSPLRNHTSLRTKSKVVNPLNETEMKEVFELFKTFLCLFINSLTLDTT